MSIPPITGIESYVNERGQLTLAGQQLFQEMARAIVDLQARVAVLEAAP